MKMMECAIVVAAVIFLVGCGGSDDGSSALLPVAQATASNTGEEVKTAEGEGDEKSAEAVPITDPDAKTSSWVNLSPEALGIAAQDPGNATAFQKSSNDQGSSSIDGIVVNVEGDFEQHRSKVVAALEKGLVVVLDSSGSESAQLRIQELSFELAQIGAKAAAVMLYKESTEDSVSLLAFRVDEKAELAALMKKVGRRGSGIQESK